MLENSKYSSENHDGGKYILIDNKKIFNAYQSNWMYPIKYAKFIKKYISELKRKNKNKINTDLIIDKPFSISSEKPPNVSIIKY